MLVWVHCSIGGPTWLTCIVHWRQHYWMHASSSDWLIQIGGPHAL